MNEKPIYNPHNIGPICAVCGCNYHKKRQFTNRCPSCRRPLLLWIAIGLIIGLTAGWLFGRDIPQVGQTAVAATSLAIAIGLVLWRWASGINSRSLACRLTGYPGVRGWVRRTD